MRQNQNQGGSNDIVRIPCEICDEPIDIRHWSTHTVSRFHINCSLSEVYLFQQTCRERELHQQRIRDRYVKVLFTSTKSKRIYLDQ